MKKAKKEVNYSLGMKESHCGKAFSDDSGYCQHFIGKQASTGKCEVVEGPINPVYWCELFKKVKK